MTTATEIVLLRDNFKLADITSNESRSKLTQALSELDQRCLSEIELRKYFEALKLAMGVFIQKVSALELDIVSLRREQVAAESRMEAMYLKAQLEIQELRSEISQIRLSKGRINQIVKVAKALQGNAYAPYAVKSLVDGVIKSSSSSSLAKKLDTTKLPSDFTSRLEFAQQNGFKWNQNNRIPNKASKQLKILEEWEDQFCKVEALSLEQVLDKKFVVGLGPGAIAGALMALERELGSLLPERKSLSIFNCYQKAIKLFHERSDLVAQTPCKIDAKSLVLDGFCNLTISEALDVEKRLKTRGLGDKSQVLASIKKLVSKSTLPTFITWRGEDDSDTEKLYAIQSGIYDEQILLFIEEHALNA